MRRSFPIVASVVACTMLALAASASAKTPAKTCTASSPNVIGHTVEGTLTSSNVDPSQARFATCAQAKEVMVKTTELRIEKPRSTKAFYCVPTVKSTGPDDVAYKCTFKGADTATFIKLTFQVKYDQD
jgi:BRCT domain type II-containing protein